MNRILIIGCPGGGKSTLARKLSRKYHLPLIHLDSIWWEPGWKMAGVEKFRPIVSRLVEGDRWLIDGNYSNTYDIRMPRAEMIIWIDQPRLLTLWRVIKRALTSLGQTRSDMAPGCPERIDFEFWRYVWTFREKHEAQIRNALAEHAKHAHIVHLRNDQEITAFTQSL